MMKHMMTVALTLVVTGTLAVAQNPRSPEVLFKAAQHAEEVQGDLKAAIEQYKKVVDAGSRAIAAQALVRMAECYQKLGDKQAEQIYERVIRDYSDQKEWVALAHTRLGIAGATSMTSRRVASVGVGGVGYGTVSPDGRYFPYTNWDNGDLYLRDLVTGADRRVTNVSGLTARPGQFAAQAVFSKDGKQLAYSWLNGRRAEIRIIDATAAGGAQPRLVFSNEDIADIWPDDWSGDGHWLAVQVRRQDKTAQLGLLAVQDGSLRVLKSVDWRGATRLMFSPDGKYLAYDLPVSEADNQRDVFMLAVDGSRDVSAVVHPANDVVMGWSADGSALLFSSDRSGGVGLWRLRVADGRPQGPADLLKSNVEGAPLGVTRTGALYSLVHHPRFNSAASADIQVATFDFEAGRFLSPPVAPVQHFVGANNLPVWSPDGKHLAYVSLREGATEPAAGSRNRFIIAICSLETGQIRDLQPALNLYPPMVRWSADGRSLLTHGRDVKGRQGLYRIDAQTETVSAIALSTDGGEIRWPVESPDGRKLYYVRGYIGQAEREFAVIERDLGSGSEREVIRGRNIFASGSAPLLSPDGQSIVVSREDSATKSSALLLVPVLGGQPKEIVRVDRPFIVRMQSWTPNSRAILVTVSSAFMGGLAAGADAELWRVPVDGTERRKLDLSSTGMTPFSVHPDGRQIAYGLTERAKDDEVWVLENFLPAPSAKK